MTKSGTAIVQPFRDQGENTAPMSHTGIESSRPWWHHTASHATMIDSRRVSKLAATGGLALVYFGVGKLALHLAFLHASASPFWPPAGIALAALLVLGYDVWPAILLGAFFANAITAGNILTSLCIAAGNTLEALCGVWLINRFAGGTRVFDRAQDVFKFFLFAALSTSVSASIGPTSLAAAGFADWSKFGPIWLTWWLGDMTGYLVVTPLVLLWWLGPRWSWDRKKTLEAMVLLVMLVGLGELVFGGWFEDFIKNYPISFVCGPIVLWTAYRFTPRETATAIFILSVVAIWGTLNRFGPYNESTPNQSLLMLQAWTGVLTLTCMTLAAAMTERRRAEAALEEQKTAIENANRTKDNFLAMLSHELRTPLTPVIALLDLLEGEPGHSPDSQGMLKTIRRNIELEKRLIDDLLDITRIARGKLQVDLKTIDANEAISHVVEICRADLVAKKLSLTLKLEATDSHIAADSARFQQIVWNLLNNAIKFTPEHGQIVVATFNRPLREFVVEVRDTGIGFEPRSMERLFDAFEQGDQSSQLRHAGLGLGLAISKAIALAHGATIKAESDGPNRGATFHLTLRTVTASEISVISDRPVDEQLRRNLRILLVDDHIDSCDALRKLLSRRGHTVVVRHDVSSATEASKADQFDLLVSDVALPDGTGIDLMTRLRQNSSLPGIAISGFGRNDDVERSLKAGFSEHLVKPISLETLEGAIARVFDGKAG
jgi:signal transduction histidine kinase